jgi:hypothetical protein
MDFKQFLPAHGKKEKLDRVVASLEGYVVTVCARHKKEASGR